MTTQAPSVRYATEADVPEILAIIRELAEYEHEPDSVLATEETLRATLSFAKSGSTTTAAAAAAAAATKDSSATDFCTADGKGRPGYAKTLLVFPPDNPETPAGMALFFHNYSTWRAAPGIYLEDLFVRPAFRGRGYGGLLLRELARAVRAAGGARLEWSVLKWNQPSIDFYLGPSVGATRMEDWVGMRVDGPALDRLADGTGRDGSAAEGTK